MSTETSIYILLRGLVKEHSYLVLNFSKYNISSLQRGTMFNCLGNRGLTDIKILRAMSVCTFCDSSVNKGNNKTSPVPLGKRRMHFVSGRHDDDR